jgi:hypothetical protein
VLPHNSRILDFYVRYCTGAAATDALPSAALPLFYPPFAGGGTLVIGFNPSLAPNEQETLDRIPSLTTENAAVVEQLCIEAQIKAHAELRFFKRRHERLDGQVPAPIQHFDLLPIRHSRQRAFEDLLTANHLRAGIQMLDDLVEQIQPEVVWIANKGVWRHLARHSENRAAMRKHPFDPDRPDRAFAVSGLFARAQVVVTNPFTSQYPDNEHTAVELQKVFSHLRQAAAVLPRN